MRRPPTLLLVLGIVAPLFAAISAMAEPIADCGPLAGTVDVTGLMLCTHGDDEPPPGVDTTELPSTDELWAARFGMLPGSVVSAGDTATVAAAAGSVACIDDGVSGPRVQLVYARAADVPDRYAPVLPLVQQYAVDADSIVNVSAGRVGDGRRIRYVTGDDCKPQVLNIALTTSGDDSFDNTVSELRAQGLTSPDRKYLVFVDAAVGICGLGQVYLDDRAGAENANNSGRPMYSRVDTACWQHAATHELLHTLGAVQNSAPNSSGAGHCTDEVDVMCYRDAPATTTRQVCSRAGQVDCNNDDYFHPNPEAGSYLATKWNVASSRFLEATSAPPPPASVTATVPAAGLAGVPWTVRAEVASADAAIMWTSTRTDCVFANPSAAQTSWSCPATAQGAAEVTVHVTEDGVATPYSMPVTFTASSPSATTLTLRTSTRRVISGRQVTLTAAVVDAAEGRPVFGLPVTYWSQDSSSGQWERIASGVTNLAGRATAAAAPSRNTSYVARIDQGAAWAAATSRQASVGVRSKVTGRLGNPTLVPGDAVRVTGTVSPDKSGQTVRLQRYTRGRWVKVMARRVRDDSRYLFRFEVKGAGRQRVRVVKAADAHNARGATAAMVLSVR